jgi:hypothetical protein
LREAGWPAASAERPGFGGPVEGGWGVLTVCEAFTVRWLPWHGELVRCFALAAIRWLKEGGIFGGRLATGKTGRGVLKRSLGRSR